MQRFFAPVAFAIALLASPASADPRDVDIVLQVHSLTPATDRIMRDEVSRIWAHDNVHVAWRSDETQVPAAGQFVRLLFLEGPSPARGAGQFPVLGQFLPDERRIRVSLPAVAAQARAAADEYPPSRRDIEYQRALGYALGRVVAHELGHALLGTTHSQAGLMVATFDAAAIADATDARFRLSAADAARLDDERQQARVASRDDEPATQTIATDGDLLAR